MTNCYLCGDEINAQNESVEHIIPNCIGGRLKSKKLLCIDCNSKMGESLEAIVSKQFHFITNFLSIKRERGETPSIKLKNEDTGEEIFVDGGFPKHIKPTIEKMKDGKFRIAARDTKQMREILKSFKRKYPDAKIDIEEIMKNYTVSRHYLNEKYGTSLSFGGSEMFKAITKIAINYYLFSNFNKRHINSLLNQFSITTPFESREIANFYYTNYDIIPKDNDEVLHSIIIIGDRDERLLYGYVELFNFFRCIVLFCDDYDGDNIIATYHYDVLNCITISKSHNLQLTREQILDSLDAGTELFKNNISGLKRELNNISKIIEKKQKDNVQRRIIKDVVDDVFDQEKYKDELYITQEMILELSNKLPHEMVKYLFRMDDEIELHQ